MIFGSAPEFWWKKPGVLATVLLPFSWVYGNISSRRIQNARSRRASIPVLCVGNFTVGGSGKTPLALAVAKAAIAAGLKPGFITRGHGGTVKKSRLATESDTALSIGDEAMLLARVAPVSVGKDRATSAKLLAEAGCTIAIMDDGFQSRSITIDYSIIAVDARRAIGNGYVLPAGPLRAPLAIQIPFADQIIVVGNGEAGDAVVRAASRAAKPVARALLSPRNIGKVKNKKLMAFAGIADPEKFYATLHEMGAILVQTRSFPDHHPFTDGDLQSLLNDSADLMLVTTEKDLVRIQSNGQIQKQILEKIITIPVQIIFQVDGVLERALEETVKRFKSI